QVQYASKFWRVNNKHELKTQKLVFIIVKLPVRP
ncbi:MAG: hypothetical protein ACI89W_001634, partial [Gammaproteobacteria bacterium]